jgi:hypothetical protein
VIRWLGWVETSSRCWSRITAKHFDAVIVARKLLDDFRATRSSLAGHEVHISASIGIGCYPADGQEAHELIKNADAAMYRAKAKGRSNYACYAREMTEHAVERLRLEAMLAALDRQPQELRVYFQPQVDLAERRASRRRGAGSLAATPNWDWSLPREFVPLAEETGFIAALGEWVLREACSRASAWRALGHDLPKITVNLSIKQFDARKRGRPGRGRSSPRPGCQPGAWRWKSPSLSSRKAEDAIRFVEGLRARSVCTCRWTISEPAIRRSRISSACRCRPSRSISPS